MKPRSLITRITPLLILLFISVTPHTAHADIDSFDDVIEALKQMQRDDPDFSKLRDPEGTIKDYIKSSIEKTFVDSILGQEVDPIMAKIFNKTHAAMTLKMSSERSKCNRAVLNIATNVSSNLDRRAMLTGFARIGIDTIKEIFGVAVNPADYIKGKIKSGYKDLLKKLYQDAVKDALKGMTTPMEFESDFSLFGQSYATCSPKVIARWIPASGTYRVYIKGDCGCSAMPEGALVGRNHILGKWEVQAIGTIEPVVIIEGDSVSIDYKVKRPRIVIHSDDSRPNCGCKKRPSPINVAINPANLALNPGDPGQINVTATDSATGNAVNIRSATISGLVPVIKGNTEPPAAGLPGGMATFAFTVAKPRKDRVYAVTVQVITVDGATLSDRGTVTVKNVAPKIPEEVPGTDADPGALMDLQNISVKVVDDNADNNNPGEVRVFSLTLGGHPEGLNTDKKFDRVDRRSKKSFDSSTGTYIFEFSRNGGRVEKPHKHKEFTTDVRVNDDNGETANAPFTLEVNDVAPTVEKIKVEPQFVHAGDDKKITITGIFQDDNGWDDIKNETSYVDATAAGGEKFILNDTLKIIKKEKDYIEFKAEPFPHTITIGKHSIPVHVEDKGPADGDHPDGPHSGDDDTFLNVGDEKPVINPWGYIYSLELGGIPDPEQKGDGLCQGQPFTAGAIVKDPENDPLTVTATIVETGVQVQLVRAEGEKTYKGVLFAPQTPGDYTLPFDAKEKPPLTQAADPKTSKLTVIPCGDDQVDDLGFGSDVNPQEVCPGGSFVATGYEILYMKDKTQKKINLPGTITFQGNSQPITPADPSATFTAPDTPGTYPVTIELNLDGQKIKLENQITVVACNESCVRTATSLTHGDWVETELVDLQLSGGGVTLNLVSQQSASGQAPMRAFIQDPLNNHFVGNAGRFGDIPTEIVALSLSADGINLNLGSQSESDLPGQENTSEDRGEVIPEAGWEKRLSEAFLRDTGDSPTAVTPGSGSAFEWEKISPRIGLTYDIFSDGTTLFKAGYSRFNDHLKQVNLDYTAGAKFSCPPGQDINRLDINSLDDVQLQLGDSFRYTASSSGASHTLDSFVGSRDIIFNARGSMDYKYDFLGDGPIIKDKLWWFGRTPLVDPGNSGIDSINYYDTFSSSSARNYNYDKFANGFHDSFNNYRLDLGRVYSDRLQLHPRYFPHFDYSYSRYGQGQSQKSAKKSAIDPPAKTGSVPSDPYFHAKGSWGQDFDDQWGLKRIGFDAIDRGNKDALWPGKAKPVIVAVVDSGIDFGHPDLYGTSWVNLSEIPNNGKDDDGNGLVDDFYGWNFVDDNNNVRDLNGHGTFVAGIIGAATDNSFGIAGVNPWARIMPVKVTDFSNHGNNIDLSKGIAYAASMGARVINVSIGGNTLTEIEQSAIDFAISQGALVVVAAGNGPVNIKDFSPAGLKGVITVAAIDRSDSRLAISNWGEAVDIAAPGADILSLRAIQTDMLLFEDKNYRSGSNIVGKNRFYYYTSGTSFSASYVAGVASLLFAKNPDLTPEQVKRIILHSARDIEVPGWDQLTGYGLLDAKAALKSEPGFFIESRITSAEVIEEENAVSIQLTGTADSDQFKKAWIEIGKGDDPMQWKVVVTEINRPVKKGVLGTIPSAEFKGSDEWIIRLITEHRNGKKREARFSLKQEPSRKSRRINKR